MQCQSCGRWLPPGAAVCPACGMHVPLQATPPTPDFSFSEYTSYGKNIPYVPSTPNVGPSSAPSSQQLPLGSPSQPQWGQQPPYYVPQQQFPQQPPPHVQMKRHVSLAVVFFIFSSVLSLGMFCTLLSDDNVADWNPGSTLSNIALSFVVLALITLMVAIALSMRDLRKERNLRSYWYGKHIIFKDEFGIERIGIVVSVHAWKTEGSLGVESGRGTYTRRSSEVRIYHG